MGGLVLIEIGVGVVLTALQLLYPNSQYLGNGLLLLGVGLIVDGVRREVKSAVGRLYLFVAVGVVGSLWLAFYVAKNSDQTVTNLSNTAPPTTLDPIPPEKPAKPTQPTAPRPLSPSVVVVPTNPPQPREPRTPNATVSGSTCLNPVKFSQKAVQGDSGQYPYAKLVTIFPNHAGRLRLFATGDLDGPIDTVSPAGFSVSTTVMGPPLTAADIQLGDSLPSSFVLRIRTPRKVETVCVDAIAQRPVNSIKIMRFEIRPYSTGQKLLVNVLISSIDRAKIRLSYSRSLEPLLDEYSAKRSREEAIWGTVTKQMADNKAVLTLPAKEGTGFVLESVEPLTQEVVDNLKTIWTYYFMLLIVPEDGSPPIEGCIHTRKGSFAEYDYCIDHN